MSKIGIVSLGCSKNTVDAEMMLALLKGKGHEIVNDPDLADIIIVNTCGFIESAKEESINALLEMAEYKNKNCKLLIATGCLAQRYADDILKEMPEVDAVLGTGSYKEIADVINSANLGERQKRLGDINFKYTGSERVLTTPAYSAFLKIAEGCDNFCTYCVIPKLRGRYRSREIDDIIKEARALAKSGVKELIVIAQDTTRYGVDLYGEKKLAKLLERLSEIEGIEWIRVHYSYPEEIDDNLIETFKNNDKIVKYIDIPIQHCNDRILKLMGRRTTKESLVNLIKKLRREIPGIAIRTSLIVGFPTETEEEFLELCEFVKEAKFDRLGVFTYSKEEDTPAAKLKGQIPKRVKEARFRKIMKLQNKIHIEKNEEFIGKDLLVLVEGFDGTLYYGRSYRDSIDIDPKVYFGALSDIKAGDFVKVRINSCLDYDLAGEMLL